MVHFANSSLQECRKRVLKLGVKTGIMPFCRPDEMIVLAVEMVHGASLLQDTATHITKRHCNQDRVVMQMKTKSDDPIGIRGVSQYLKANVLFFFTE